MLSRTLCKRFLIWWHVVLFVLSVITAGALIVDYGFVLDDGERAIIAVIYRVSWWAYLLSYSIDMVVGWRKINRRTLFLTLFLGVLLLLGTLPMLLGAEQYNWLSLFSNHYFYKAVLLLFSVLEISRGVVGFINKRTNPALLLAACFLVVIAVGTLLLLLPRSTLEHIRLSVVDALFVSTSAVCVTGLSPLDIAQTFTIEGQLVLMLLIQIGGLGVMTITSFFAVFFMGGAGLYNQFALRDMVGSDAFSSLISTLLYILGFTFAIELIGAFCIWLSIHTTLGMDFYEELFFSIFHSVSAFCNAGFSTLSGNLGNEAVLTGHNTFYLIVSLLVVLGGIGFPLLVNMKQIAGYHISRLVNVRLRKIKKQPRFLHITNINTKIVFTMTGVLVLGGTLSLAILEWNGAFAGMSVSDKIVQSFFNAVVPRTAGFNSVELTSFSMPTIALYVLLMWIGGASQSTAGGVKVNTFAVAFANLLAVVKGHTGVVLFGREISVVTLRRASAVVFGSFAAIAVVFFMLLLMEPAIPSKGLLFETVSAYCTVGSSLNVTPLLGSGSKLLLSVMMFVGRIGLVTILMSIIPPTGVRKVRYPKDDVIIN